MLFCLIALFFLVQTVAHAQETQPVNKITYSKKQNELRLYGKDNKTPFKTIHLGETYDVRTYDVAKKDSIWVVGIEMTTNGVVICKTDSLGKNTVCTYYPGGDDYNLNHHPKTEKVPAVLEHNEWKHKDKGDKDK